MSEIQSVIEIPFGFQGKVFRSPMPFGPYDELNRVWDRYIELNIKRVLVLAEMEEIATHSQRNLLDFYIGKGLQVYHYPIADFSVPENMGEFDRVISQVINNAEAGVNSAIHCLAGFGRTGLILAAITRVRFGFDGMNAIRWVRNFIPGAVENSDQVNFIRTYKISE
jgi:atypical dual specificity phosphatase